MDGTQLVKCTCKHEYQDKLNNGIGIRVANIMRNGQARCTICSAVHGSATFTKQTKTKDKITQDSKESETKKKPDEKSIEKSDKKKSLKGNKR